MQLREIAIRNREILQMLTRKQLGTHGICGALDVHGDGGAALLSFSSVRAPAAVSAATAACRDRVISDSADSSFDEERIQLDYNARAIKRLNSTHAHTTAWAAGQPLIAGRCTRSYAHWQDCK